MSAVSWTFYAAPFVCSSVHVQIQHYSFFHPRDIKALLVMKWMSGRWLRQKLQHVSCLWNPFLKEAEERTHPASLIAFRHSQMSEFLARVTVGKWLNVSHSTLQKQLISWHLNPEGSLRGDLENVRRTMQTLVWEFFLVYNKMSMQTHKFKVCM